VRAVDLAVYADTIAAEAASLSARLERARRRLREAAIESEARRTLPRETVTRLEALGLLGLPEVEVETREIAEAQAALAAVEQLQAWVERELYAAGAGARSLSPVSRAAR
jgi:hypothetical protein